MFITEEQLAARLGNPRNLANRFHNGRQIIDKATDAYKDVSEVVSEEVSEEVSNENQEFQTENAGENEGQENLHQEGIQFRTINRPGNNRPWLSKEERTRIATDVASAPINGNQTRSEIAKTYSVRPSTVTDIANKTRRIEDTPRSVDQAKLDSALGVVRETSINRLMTSLGQLTEDKISAHNAKDISTICANMAKVVQQTIPQDKVAQAINLIVYTPEMRKESNFEIVEIG